MGNTLTGSGSEEPSHPSVLQHEEVQSEKDRLIDAQPEHVTGGACRARMLYTWGMLFLQVGGSLLS